jgi:hypothetical protein
LHKVQACGGNAASIVVAMCVNTKYRVPCTAHDVIIDHNASWLSHWEPQYSRRNQSGVRMYGVKCETSLLKICICQPKMPSGCQVMRCDSHNTDINDTGCRILYMLEVQLRTKNQPMDRAPPDSVGFSIVTWIRTGRLMNVPTPRVVARQLVCFSLHLTRQQFN